MNTETIEESLPGSNVVQIAEKLPSQLIKEQDAMARIKIKLNTLLWEELPAKITLGQAEKCACDMLCRMMKLID